MATKGCNLQFSFFLFYHGWKRGQDDGHDADLTWRRNPWTLVQYNLEIEVSAHRNHGQVLRRKKQPEQRERQSNLESTSATPSREPKPTTNEGPSPNATTPITNPSFEPEPMGIGGSRR
ncbi:hypothetical protein J1N35_008184 [Gossypium stocksii]|uniref:Uncharacterized protein n=1 Tax=Gossypium stocksii TaxID=47602 RepID=A0A9D3W8M3_9ROSI|nr:hypothetical protein J1N35_008184 [Gossypium stocksii]